MSSTAEPWAHSHSQSHLLDHQAKEDKSSDGAMLFAVLVRAFGSLQKSVGNASISQIETKGLIFGLAPNTRSQMHTSHGNPCQEV